MPGLEHSIIQFVGQHRLSTTCIFFQLHEFIGYYDGGGHSQDNEGDLTVSLAAAGHVEVRELGLRSQGIRLFSTRALRRHHPKMSGRHAPDGGGPHLSSRDSQSVFETILPVRPVAGRLLYRDVCALRRGQSSSKWRRASCSPRTPGRHQRALLCSPLLQDIG